MTEPFSTISITENNTNITLTDDYQNIAIEGNSFTATINLSKATVDKGTLTTNLGKTSTFYGTSADDFVFAKSGSLLVGNGGDDTLQVSGAFTESPCILIGGEGEDTLKVISSENIDSPNCILVGGPGTDEFILIGGKIMVADMEQGERISLGDSKVEQIITPEGLLLRTEKTEKSSWRIFQGDFWDSRYFFR